MPQSREAPLATWSAPLLALVRELLSSLRVPYEPRSLAQKALQEYELVFQVTPNWPDFLSDFEAAASRLVDKQVEALRNVLLAYDVWLEVHEVDLETLSRVTGPLVVVLRQAAGDAGRLAVLGRCSPGQEDVSYWLPNGREVTVERGVFAAEWAGLVLTCKGIASGSCTGRESEGRSAKLQRLGGIVAAATGATLIAAGLYHAGAGAVAGHLVSASLGLSLLKILGITLCVSISSLERRAKAGPIALQALCTLHRKFSCEKVLASRGARFLGIVSLADIGLAYFVATLVVIWVGFAVRRVDELLPLIALMSILSLPLTAYSIAYQARVVRAWCPLCLGVQVSLWFEAAIAVWILRRDGIAAAQLGVGVLVAAIFVAVSLVLWLKRQGDAARARSRDVGARLAVLQRNAEAFRGLLQSGPKGDTSPLPGDLLMGGAEASIAILALLDPQCHRCARCFADLRRLVHSLPEVFQVRVRLVAEYTPLSTVKTLITLVEKGGDEAEEFLENWYQYVLRLLAEGKISGSGDVTEAIYSRWLIESGRVAPELSSWSESALGAQVRWELSWEITGWPALFVNGHAWPPYYDRWKHLLYYAEEIGELAVADGGDLPDSGGNAVLSRPAVEEERVATGGDGGRAIRRVRTELAGAPAE